MHDHIASWIWVLIPLAAIYFSHQRKMSNNDPQQKPDAESDRLRDEVRTLKERIAVLERIATEDAPAKALDREIERLR
jgi:hypothetical protein